MSVKIKLLGIDSKRKNVYVPMPHKSWIGTYSVCYKKIGFFLLSKVKLM